MSSQLKSSSFSSFSPFLTIFPGVSLYLTILTFPILFRSGWCPASRHMTNYWVKNYNKKHLVRLTKVFTQVSSLTNFYPGKWMFVFFTASSSQTIACSNTHEQCIHSKYRYARQRQFKSRASWRKRESKLFGFMIYSRDLQIMTQKVSGKVSTLKKKYEFVERDDISNNNREWKKWWLFN